MSHFRPLRGGFTGDAGPWLQVAAIVSRLARMDRRVNGRWDPLLLEFTEAIEQAARTATDDEATREVPPSEVAPAVPATVWISTAEAGRRMGCSARHVRTLVTQGTLPSQRVGSTWLVDASAVDRTQRRDG